MNCRLPLALIAASLGSAAAAEQSSAIRFATKERDWLSGSLESVTADQVVWNAPTLKQPTPFWTKSVLELTLPALIHEQEVSHEATLHLMGGDVVRGQLDSVTDDAIVLDTWYAGRLHFNRVMIREVEVEDRASITYSGPTGLEGWVQTATEPTWTFEAGALRTTGSRGIGRDVGLPDECSVAFEAEWKGGMSLNLNLFTDDLTKDSPKVGYQLTFGGSYASFEQVGGNQFMGGQESANIPEFRDGGKARVEVRISRLSGDVSLYVNGRHAKNWRGATLKSKFGKAFQFVPRSGMDSLSIAKVKVAAWDGEVAELPDENAAMGMRFGGIIRPQREPKPEPKPDPKNPDEGRMKLRNGDSIGGEVVSIANGIITVKTPFAEVKLPVGRVRNIQLKPASLEEPIRRNGDVRAWFADGSSVVFRLDSTTKDTLTGSSQTFGKATFKLAAFNRIEFNIYEEEVNNLRTKDPS